MKICPNCNNEVNDGARFCHICGTDVSNIQGQAGQQITGYGMAYNETNWQTDQQNIMPNKQEPEKKKIPVAEIVNLSIIAILVSLVTPSIVKGVSVNLFFIVISIFEVIFAIVDGIFGIINGIREKHTLRIVLSIIGIFAGIGLCGIMFVK